MKKILITLLVALWAGFAFAQWAPYSADYNYASTNAVGEFQMSRAVQPAHFFFFGVQPASGTATIQRVHGTYTQSLGSVSIASGSGSLALTNGVFLAPGDSLKITGPTNATFELQGMGW
jgi:hypothetical protein